MIPSVEQCYELMKRYGMLDNIRAHSIVVEKVATIITKGLRNAGEDLLLEKVRAGALMHDIAKTLCLNTREDHAAKGKEICLQNRLDEIADIVGEHIRLKEYQKEAPVSEKEIVYYADKRVNADAVVSLEERLDYLLERYGNGKTHLRRMIRDNFDLCKDVEGKLFSRLALDPGDLARMIEKD